MPCSATLLFSAEPCERCGASPSIVLQVSQDGASGHTPRLCTGCAQVSNPVSFPSVAPGSCARTRRAVRRQEERVASLIGGKRQPGSGNKPWESGDAYAPGAYVGEAKATARKSYTLHIDTLRKLRQECRVGEKPLLHITFIEGTGKHLERWILVPEEDWRLHAVSANRRPGPD